MKPENQALLEKAEQALRAARRDLAAGDADPAVARAYYAAFHAATAALHQEGLAARSHSGTHYLFHQHFVESGVFSAGLARVLRRLQQQREEADYAYASVHSLEAAAEALEQAEAFVAAVAGWLEGR